MDQHHQHVVTGDLSIVTNNQHQSQKHFEKGLNYIDQAPPSIHKSYQAAKIAIKNYCETMSSRLSKPLEMFTEWQTLILESVHRQLQRFKPYDYFTVLSDPVIQSELQTLHDKFVLVPTDKAQNNITVVCKKFYKSLIEKELSSDTYRLVNSPVEDIVADHRSFLLKHGIKMDPKNEKLPYIYVTPKQHKTPTGFRVITSGSMCTLQQLSKYLSVCLKSMLHSAKNKSHYDHRFHNRNDFYIVDNNEPVLDFINMNNTISGFKSINTYDFSTLYT